MFKPSLLIALLSLSALASSAAAQDIDGDGVLDGVDNCLTVANADQLDSNGDDFGNVCDPDYDQDGVVSAVDFAVFQQAFNKGLGQPGYNPDVDHDGNGFIDASDYLVFGSYYNGPPGPSGRAPFSLHIGSPDDGQLVAGASIAVTGWVNREGATVTIDGVLATPVGVAFSETVSLAEGVTSIVVVATSGSETLTKTVSVVYESSPPPVPTLVVPAIDDTRINVVGADTRFLYEGAGAIQTGAGTIYADRAAVVRGRVVTRGGAPLPGVRVSIASHAEFGETRSRQNGEYDLAVNGGGSLIVVYERPNFLPARRRLEVPWQSFSMVDDVALVPIDEVATPVSPNAPTMQVARGSLAADADGERQATILIPKNTTATLVFSDGRPPQSYGSTVMTMRATEFTVGENGAAAMPAPLPPESAYTYAVDLRVDEAEAAGASSIEFSQPLPIYLENFLEMPAGMPIPSGYYDREAEAWIPSPDGRVIKILSETGGYADLGSTGTLVISDDERQRLAELYEPGQTLWRVPVTHFSIFDFNFPRWLGFLLAEFASATPNTNAGGAGSSGEAQQCGGSTIAIDSQTLWEEIDLVGSDLSLHYSSGRARGRVSDYTVELDLAGFEDPSLTKVEVNLDIAGRRYTKTVLSGNETVSLTWDGHDAYGRRVNGAQAGKLSVLAVYDVGSYARPSGPSPSFGRRGTELTAEEEKVTPRLGFVHTEGIEVELGVLDARAQGLGGWTLSAHHAYDPVARRLHMGTGVCRGVAELGPVVERFAGSGSDGNPPAPDGQPALSSPLHRVAGLDVGPDGSVYFVEPENNTAYDQVRRITPNGLLDTVTVVGGIKKPRAIRVAPDGTLYVLHRTPADNLDQVSRIEGGLVTSVRVPSQGTLITEIAVGPLGELYFSEFAMGNLQKTRIYKVASPGQAADNVVGSWGEQTPADGLRASDVHFGQVHAMAVSPRGELFFTAEEGPYHRLFRVTPDGLIWVETETPTLGDPAFTPVENLALYQPTALAFDADGNLFIADERDLGNPSYQERILRVSPDGIASTVVSTLRLPILPGDPLGDGGPIAAADFGGLADLAFDEQGRLLIATRDEHTIRRITSALPGYSLGDLAIPSGDAQRLYTFDNFGRHQETLHALTGETLRSFTYSAEGRLVSTTDYDGLVTGIERDALTGNPTALVAPFGQRTDLFLGGDDLLDRVENPAGEGFDLQYHPGGGGLLSRFESPRDAASTFGYDSMGLLTADTNAAQDAMTLVASGPVGQQLVTLTSEEGVEQQAERRVAPDGTELRIHATTTGLDRALETVTARDPQGGVSRTTPDGMVFGSEAVPDSRFAMMAPVSNVTLATPSGLVLDVDRTRSVTLDPPDEVATWQETTSVGGRTTTVIYDAATSTRTTESPERRQVVQTLDGAGRVLDTTIAGIDPVFFDYDLSGRLETVSQGSGADLRLTMFDYYPANGSPQAGFLWKITDATLRETVFTYDAAGRVATQVLPGGTTGTRLIDFDYDANGNLEGLTPPGKPLHSFVFDVRDLESTYSPPWATGVTVRDTVRTYDGDKRLDVLTHPDGDVLDFDYDVAGRLDGLTWTPPVGLAETTDYVYDDADGGEETGLLEAVLGPDGVDLAYEYDGAYRTLTTWSGDVAGTLRFALDGDHRLSSETVSDGTTSSTVSYFYDWDDLLTDAGALVLERDPANGLLESTALGGSGGVHTSQTYNAFGELATLSVRYPGATGSLLYGLTLDDEATAQGKRDLLGRIQTKSETIVDPATSGLDTATRIYAYDAAGRLDTVDDGTGLVADPSYDDNGNRLSVFGEPPAAYDDQDRLASYAGTTYVYSDAGDLESKTEPGVGTTDYLYDGLGSLRHVVLPDGTEIAYGVDGAGRRVSKRVKASGSGTWVTESQWLYRDGLNPVAELDGSGTLVSRFVYGGRGNVPAYLEQGSATYRLVSDHLGSVRLVVNVADGSVAQRIDYDSWGVVTGDTNPGFQPFGFAGGVYDPDTELVRFGARDYDPRVGRWTAKDVGRFSGGLNLYAYAFNDPVNLIDVDGFAPQTPRDSISLKAQDLVLKGDKKALERFMKQLPDDFPKGRATKLLKDCQANQPLGEALKGTGQLPALRTNPNLKGVDVEKLMGQSLNQLKEAARQGKLDARTLKQVKKAFEGRPLR